MVCITPRCDLSLTNEEVLLDAARARVSSSEGRQTFHEENVVKGATWARRRRVRVTANLLDDDFAKTLHKRMFGEVWKWAGTYRQTERNIDIEAYRISAEVPALFSDVCYWVENATYPPDEIAVRLHHRLGAIHPFPNGNGRHARLMDPDIAPLIEFART